MKKKIIILIPLLFILCGCTAEVDINIDDKQIQESISIDAESNEYYTKEQLLTAFREYIPAYAENTIIDTMPDEPVKGISYYKRTYQDLNDGYRFTYKYNFNIENYNKARTVKGAFKSSNIQLSKKDQEILISTDNSSIGYFYEYPSLSRITINIKTDYIVKENNADRINGNVYTWYFSNSTNNNIYMLLDSEKKITDTNVESKKDSEKKEEVKKENKFIEFVNKHPILVAVASIVLFIILTSTFSKLLKNKY